MAAEISLINICIIFSSYFYLLKLIVIIYIFSTLTKVVVSSSINDKVFMFILKMTVRQTVTLQF